MQVHKERSDSSRIAESNSKLGSVLVGTGFPVRVMAVVNVSPESFYKGSVATTAREISARVRKAAEGGADLVDIGGMSTAPYLKSEVSEETELSRIQTALRAIADIEITISVDTLHSSVADFALRNGASVINDVSGLKNDAEMARVVRDHGASLLAMAHSSKISRTRPIVQVRDALEETLRIAERAGIDHRHIVLDPGIGFFRKEGSGPAYSPQKLMPWYEWDCQVLADLVELESLHRPLCLGLSRKSFLGKVLERGNVDERLPGSLAAAAIAVINGAHMIRTHDVKETLQAVRVAEAIKRQVRRAASVS